MANAGLHVENIQCSIGIHLPFSPASLYIVPARTVRLPIQGGWRPCYLHHLKSLPPRKGYCPGQACPADLYGSVPTENRALDKALLAEHRLLLCPAPPVPRQTSCPVLALYSALFAERRLLLRLAAAGIH